MSTELSPANAGQGAGRNARGKAGFLALSVVLTGFDLYELQGTGVSDELFATLRRIVPGPTRELLRVWREVSRAPTPAEVEAGVRTRIMDDPRLGPVARNVITMWYTGLWVPLPNEWHYAWGTPPGDVNHVVSALAYQESLVWKAAGTHPMGARQPGFGTWALPPRA